MERACLRAVAQAFSIVRCRLPSAVAQALHHGLGRLRVALRWHRGGAVLDQWREEVAALPRRKRGKWHGFLSDKWQVRQRVRYVGEIRHVDEGVP